MKKNHPFKTTLLIGLLMAGFVLPNPDLLAEDPPGEEPNVEIMRGFTPTNKRVVVGYHLESFGFIGGTFSRIVREYDYMRCCEPTGDPMDGCSLQTVCPRR